MMRVLSTATASVRRGLRSQGGFGMIELMIAGGIILVAVLSISISVLVGFSDIALARQRQSANGLADQTMEQVRGLPLDTLARGLSNSTHPFAAPCQPFLYGLSSRDQGHIDVTGSITGLTLDHASIWLPGEGSAIQVEQISAIQGVAQSSGVALQRTGQSEVLFGRQAVSSGSDNDPAQP